MAGLIWKNRAMPSAAGVIAHRWSRSALLGATSRNLLAAGIGVVLAAASFIGAPAILAVLFVAAVGLALGWPRLVGLPSMLGSILVIATSSVIGLATVLAAGSLVPLLAVLGFAVVAAFVHEMARRDGRPRLVESVTGTVTGAVAAVSVAGWLVVSGVGPPAVLVTATGAALAVAALAALLPLGKRYTSPIAVSLGVLAGLAVAWQLPALDYLTGGAIGGGAGLMTASVRVLFDHYPASGRPSASGAIAALPVCALGVPSYAVALLLAG
jgi:hypothetical protein